MGNGFVVMGLPSALTRRRGRRIGRFVGNLHCVSYRNVGMDEKQVKQVRQVIRPNFDPKSPIEILEQTDIVRIAIYIYMREGFGGGEIKQTPTPTPTQRCTLPRIVVLCWCWCWFWCLVRGPGGKHKTNTNAGVHFVSCFFFLVLLVLV